MQFKKINSGYIVKIEKGEEIVRTLTEFCENNGITFGSMAGIGGADDINISYYDLQRKQYSPKNFSGQNYEIISLNGNIALVNGKPFVHIHIAISGPDGHVFGGHLESAVIAVTGEIIISLADGEVNRKFDEKMKLNLLDIQ